MSFLYIYGIIYPRTYFILNRPIVGKYNHCILFRIAAVRVHVCTLGEEGVFRKGRSV